MIALPNRAFLLLLLGSMGLPARADDRENCLLCHQLPGLARFDVTAGRLHLFHVDPRYVQEGAGPHARLACTDCHAREQVAIVPHRPVTPVDCLRQCHLSADAGIARRFSHENVARMLEGSDHGSAALEGLQLSHGALLREGQSQCLYCHDEPLFRSNILSQGGHDGEDRTFDRCDVCHTSQLAVDIEFSLRHIAARLAPARSNLEQAQVCAVCHSDKGFRKQYDAPDAVASYLHSFHGKAALLGDESTAGCVSCHVAAGSNFHELVGPEHPDSAVHATRVADGCRTVQCHPGADPSIGATAVHLDLAAARGTLAFLLAASFVVLTIAAFTPWALVAVLELFRFIVAGRSDETHRLETLARRLQEHPEGRVRLRRYTPFQRFQHWYLAVAFIGLAVTGLPLKFADHPFSRTVIRSIGSLANARAIHHLLGVALIAGLVGHAVYVVWIVARQARQPEASGRRRGWWKAWTSQPMWLGPADLKNLWHLVRYSLFLERKPPPFDRFSLKEKFGYMAVFWGTVLLGVTGIALWAEQLASRFLGGQGLTLAAIAHADEAFLAVSYIGVLHLTDVLLSPHAVPLSMATLTGKTPVGVLATWHRGLLEKAADDLGLENKAHG